MKRLTAILLLLVVVFNFYGYRLVIDYLQQSNNSDVETRIDLRDYSEAELISIKTTLNLPYYNSSPEFERAYGSININGVDYEYVKRRVFRDTLELLCLPNYQKTKLVTVANELTKGLADGASSPVKKGLSFKFSLPDYFQQFTQELASSSTAVIRTYFSTAASFTITGYSFLPEKPPRRNA